MSSASESRVEMRTGLSPWTCAQANRSICRGQRKVRYGGRTRPFVGTNSGPLTLPMRRGSTHAESASPHRRAQRCEPAPESRQGTRAAGPWRPPRPAPRAHHSRALRCHRGPPAEPARGSPVRECPAATRPGASTRFPEVRWSIVFGPDRTPIVATERLPNRAERGSAGSGFARPSRDRRSDFFDWSRGRLQGRMQAA